MREMRSESRDRLTIQSLYDQCALRPGEIRILLLYPSRSHISPTQCAFEITDLEGNTSEYEAVSYCWGPPVNGWQIYDEKVQLSGIEETIKGNLADALRRFRHPDRERRLWVDALCINQADNVERTQQVAMMAKVYSKAARTLVWLGEDTEEFDGAVVINSCKAIDVDGPSWAYMSATDRDLWIEQQGQALGSVLKASSPWRSASAQKVKMFSELEYLIASAAQTFIHRRYFTRRWILQEIFNSKSTIVQCGEHSIGWEPLIKGCKRLPIEMQRPAPVDPGMDMVQVGVYLEALDIYTSPALDLMWCLKYFGQSECSDPRDRIYALLGFSSGGNILEADYTIPPEQVWMQVGLALLDEGHSGLLITTAAEQIYQGYERAAGLPSWLPDFSAPTNLLPRDYPAGTIALIDEQCCLNIAMRCFGEIKYLNGWPICTGMPEHLLEKVSSLPPGSWEKNPSGYWDSYYFGVPLLKSNANELRTGDLVCEVPNWKPRSFLLHLRLIEGAVYDDVMLAAIVGIASVTSAGDCLSGDLRQFRVR